MPNSSKHLIVAVCLLAAVGIGSVLSITDEDYEAWNEFKTQFNKTYDREEDEQLRRDIFLENKHYIESQKSRSQSSFEMGINALSDLTTEEINASRNGFRLFPNTSGTEFDLGGQTNLLEALLSALNEGSPDGKLKGASDRAWYDLLLGATELDYRQQGLVSKVKDQGACGSCWAFATTGALESILARRGRGVLLSEQQLVDCSRRYGNNGCDGGLMNAALRYVRDYGIMAAGNYPYTASQGSCKARPNLSVMRVRGSTTLPRGNESLLRLALALTGPIPVAIDAGQRSYHSYKSGVYDDRACRSSLRSLNHAVLLVGYGTARRGGDYWILKNSWGRSWGDNGYIKIARNRGNLCGVATFAVLPRQ